MRLCVRYSSIALPLVNNIILAGGGGLLRRSAPLGIRQRLDLQLPDHCFWFVYCVLSAGQG